MASILVLDDHAANRDLLATVIKSAGHTLVEVADGAAALELARQGRPDLIIADILMPGMDGYEFARHVRSDPEIATTRVVFYTATYLEDEVRRLAAGCGVTHVLIKPCEPEEILEVVAQALAAGPVEPASQWLAPVSDRGHARILSDKLIAKIDELEDLNRRYVELNERLHASELEYRLLFERNPLPMLVYDRASYQIVAANQAFVSNYGYSQTEITAMAIADLVPREDTEGLRRYLEANPSGIAATVSGGLPTHTWRHCYKDGTVIDVEVTTANLALQGRECRVAACLNVTERLRAATETAAARDAAIAASTVKSAFLANMSHEIRTPMNGVIGMTELLLTTELDTQQREYTELVARAGEHMMALIDDMLDISKIEAGRMTLDIAQFDLHATIADACAVARLSAHAKSISIDLSVDRMVPRWVVGDGSRLRQVLLNLVTNAVKFTDRGSVVVSVGSRATSDDAATIRCDVLDTGIGLDPATLEQMFEPFTQADTSTTRRYGGAGLGLAIAKHLVDLMEGQIGADSEPGHGSTFWFEVTLATPTAVDPGDGPRR